MCTFFIFNMIDWSILSKQLHRHLKARNLSIIDCLIKGTKNVTDSGSKNVTDKPKT